MPRGKGVPPASLYGFRHPYSTHKFNRPNPAPKEEQ